MSNIRALGARNSLGNIPHMLRNLATELETGQESMPRTVFLIALGDPNKPPELFQFGAELSRLEEAGAFAACMQRVLQVEEA